jgi:hypothetical protein
LVLHSLFFDTLALVLIYGFCLVLALGLLAALVALGWPFRKDTYTDLQDIPRSQVLILGSTLFLLLLVLYLALLYPLVLVVFFILLALSLYHFFRPGPKNNP